MSQAGREDKWPVSMDHCHILGRAPGHMAEMAGASESVNLYLPCDLGQAT